PHHRSDCHRGGATLSINMAPVAVFGLPGKPEEKIRQMMERAASAREFTVETKMNATFQQEQTERTEMEKAVSVSSACSRSTRDLSEFIRVYPSLSELSPVQCFVPRIHD